MSDSDQQPAGAGNPSVRRELLGALVVAGVFLFVDRAYLVEGRPLLAHVSADSRSALYISIAASCAALLGFSITATSILLVLGAGRRMDWLRKQKEYRETRVVFMYVIYALAVATVVFTALIVIDTGQVGAWFLEAPAAGVVTFVIIRLGWVLWLLDGLLRISLADGSEDSQTAATLSFDEPLDD